jgi:Arc/MetJ-type ribon-helix-helix transcriptional regulator
MPGIRRRKAVINCTVSPYIKDKIEELVEYGRFSTISDAVAIALLELIHKHEAELKAQGEIARMRA